MAQVTINVYRDILKKAKLFDKQTFLKVRIRPPALQKVFEAKAEERRTQLPDPYYFYTPHTIGGKSFYETFKELFKDAIRTQSVTGLTNAFSLIRDLNDTMGNQHKKESSVKKPSIVVQTPASTPRAGYTYVYVGGADGKKVQMDDSLMKEIKKITDEFQRNATPADYEFVDKVISDVYQKNIKTRAQKEENEAEEEEAEDKDSEKEENGKQEEKAVEIQSITSTSTSTTTPNASSWVKASDKLAVGTFLISHPAYDTRDSRRLDCFFRTTVLITSITPKAVYGVILNKPLYPQEIHEKYKLYAAEQREKKQTTNTLPAPLGKANWYFGGPGEIFPHQQGSLNSIVTAIHSSSQVPDSKPLFDNLHCGGDMTKFMSMIEAGEIDLSKTRLFLGGATFSPNQLRDEINRGWWIQAEASSDFVFGPHPEYQWHDALNLMGGEYTSFVQAAKTMGFSKKLEYETERIPYCTLHALNLNYPNKL